MIPADRAGEHHADDVGRQHGFAVRPACQRPQGEQHQQQIFGLELGGAVAVATEQPRGQPRQRDEDRHRDGGEQQGSQRERREDEAQGQHRAEVVDEAGGQHDLAVLGLVEAVFEHHRVDHRDRRGRERDAGKPARHQGPAEDPIGRRGAAQEGREKPDQPQRRRFLPIAPEYDGVELRAGQEREHDGAGAGQELDPGFVASEHVGAEEGSEDQLRERSDDDLGQRRRYAEPQCEQRGEKRQSEPQGSQRPSVGHRRLGC